MRHLLSLKEQTREDLLELLDRAMRLKLISCAGNGTDLLRNRTLVMLFQKTSTRTRLSYEAAMTQLGGHAIYLDMRTSQFALTDMRDEMRAVLQFGDALMFRANRFADVEMAAQIGRIPVIDGCSEKYHPSQALADLLTMSECAGGIDKVSKVAWLGIENNVSNTLMLACVKLGIRFSIAAGEVDVQSIDPHLEAQAQATGLVERTNDPSVAVADADFVHTDTWMNMEFFEDGKVKSEFREAYEHRKRILLPYQLNAALIDTYAPPHARIMHCMPCHVGYEISRDAIDHRRSVIFEQAENRLHMQKAMLCWLLRV